MKGKRFTLFWKKLLIMDLGLIVILVRIFGMILGYLTKRANNDSIFPQNDQNGYPFFDSINCDVTNMVHILETNDLDNSNNTNNNNDEIIFNSIINFFKSNKCSFNNKINICSDKKKCYDELDNKELNFDFDNKLNNLSDLYFINNQGKTKISNIINLFQEKNEFNINNNNIQIESYYKLFSGYNSYLNIKLYEQENNINNYGLIKEVTNYEDRVNNLFYTYSLLLKAYTILYPNKLFSSKIDSVQYINECLRENDDEFINKKSIFNSEINKQKIYNILNIELNNIINCIPDFKSRFSYTIDLNAIKTTIVTLLYQNDAIKKINKKEKKIFNFFLKEFSKSIKTIFIADIHLRQRANIFLKYQPYFIVIFICISLGTLIFINRYFIKHRQYYNHGSKLLEKYKRDRYNFMYNNKHHQYMEKLKEIEENKKKEKNENNNINRNALNNKDILDDKDKCTKEELEYIEKLAKENKGDFILAK